jgi:aspartate/tyrosine/aromatic aminotransferase
MVSPSRHKYHWQVSPISHLCLQVGAEFLARHYPVHTVLLPNPTWANHNKIFPLAGIKDVRKYRYFKPSTKGLDYEVRLAKAPSCISIRAMSEHIYHEL